MKKKTLAMLLAVCLMATAVIGGSLAYFTDTDAKTNTFTVGKVDITLVEDKWVEDSKIIPGATIDKNPTITVAEDSETAYTFMKVELSQDFVALLTEYAEAEGTANPAAVIEAWFTTSTSPKIMALGADYVILGVLSPKAAGESVTYFDQVKVPAEVTQEMIKADGAYTIEITAYAIQAEGFYDEADKQASRQAAFKALFPDETLIP